MHIPDEFAYLAGCPWDVLATEAASLDALIARVANLLDESKRVVLRRFLDELFRGDLSDLDLAQLWRDAGAGVSFPGEGDLRKILMLVRQKISDPGSVPS